MSWSSSPSRRDASGLKVGAARSRTRTASGGRAKAGVQLADQAGDVASGLVGEVGVTAEWWAMTSGVFSVRSRGGWKNISGGRPSHSTIRRKFARSGRSPFLDPGERVERDVALVCRSPQAEAQFLAALADARFSGVDVDGIFHPCLPPARARGRGHHSAEPDCATGLVGDVTPPVCTS